MLRIAHLTSVHHPSDPRIFRKQLATLAQAGFEAHLVAPHEESEVRDGVHLTALPSPKGRYRRALLLPSMYRAARRLEAALYHFHDPELIPLAFLLKKTTGARVVYDMHEDYRGHGPVEGRVLRALECWCFRWVDHVVVANAAHARIPAASGTPCTVIANYYRPPDAKQSVGTRSSLHRFRVAYTGVMSKTRGLLTLVDLAALFQRKHPAWRLDLTGVCYRVEDRCEAERRMRRLDVSNSLEEMGWDSYVPWKCIDRCHRRAHVGVVLWSRARARQRVIPTKFYEYLSAGLPIVCSDFPRWKSFIQRHDCGATVPPGDAEAVVSVLERWVADPRRYEALAKNARAAARHYQWPVMGRRLVHLYNRLLGSDYVLPSVREHSLSTLSG